ncbi:MAG: response regulator transcription factor [Bacilli bacterium]|nr:response regulator transcription factor [Bacilli bacterium]
MPYKVLIVEDQQMPRQLLEIFISSNKNYVHQASLNDASLALAYCQNKEVDLILMDVYTFQGNSGLLAAEEIKKQFPDIKIIIVTSLPEYSWIKKAKEIGVDSFWYKDENKENIIEIIDRTMKGEHIYPDETPLVKLGQVTNHDLTDRELEILKEMLTGDSNQEIAERLFLSPGTVKRHVENLLFKTGFHTRTELVAEAVRLGIVINEKK